MAGRRGGHRLGICCAVSALLHACGLGLLASRSAAEGQPGIPGPQRPIAAGLALAPPRVTPPLAAQAPSDTGSRPASDARKPPQPRAAASPPAPLDAARGGPEGSYLPRPLLTRSPEPLQEVRIAAPISDAPAARYVGVLALFIDETGRVREVREDPPRLPPEMQRAAHDAFMAARFSPGELDGRPVRSRLRVQVVFEHWPPAQD